MPLLDVLQASTPLWLTSCAWLGLLVGSFLNVVIHRLPLMLERRWRVEAAEFLGQPLPDAPRYNLIFPRSACPHCARPLTARENIPLLSFVLQGGRCRGCQQPIAWRYPLVELAASGLALLAAAHFGYGWTAVAAMLLLWTLLVLACIDLDTQLLPDDLTLPLLWLGLLLNLGGLFADLSSAVIGAAAGYLCLWLIFWVFKWATGKEGMGYGDFKLLAAIGAWLGWQSLPLVLLLSSLVGATVGIGLMVVRRNSAATQIPFGPYLAGGAVMALFWGEVLMRAYWESV